MDTIQDMARATWPDWAHLTWTGPHVKATLPPVSFFEFPPSSQPSVLQPPPRDTTFAHPFTIPEDWYNLLLSPNVPITFALVYASVITLLNSVNARRKYKPWAISKSPLFKIFVLIHNAFLSLYSLWTFIGMVNALRLSLEPPTGPYGLAGTIDSLCKLNGPRGFGSAATFDGTTNTWGFTNRNFHLNKDTNFPEFSDVGRMWNEGLSFYGWIFYISKFYEVIDTLIIIAKGKKSSFLQTYHHAGAMLCMWAGVRYMSPPIWVFVTVNSFVHFIMYAFYFLTTLGVRIPKPIKQTLTTVQITQFVVGAAFAFAHLFVAYQIPISTPYIYHLGDTVRSIASSVSADASSVISTATAVASADPGSWLKKLALRAAGREGLAENVENRMHEKFGIDAAHAVKDFVRREETRYREELRFTHCIDTSGQAFAIYLNIFYLLPLTWLFAQFFVKSYLKRSDEIRRSSLSDRAYIASQSLNDASKGVGRRLSEAFEDYQGTNGDLDGEAVLVDGDQIRKEIRELTEQAKTTGSKAVKKGKETVDAASEKISQIDTAKVKQDVQADLAKLRKSAKSGAESVEATIKKNQPSDETKQKVKETAQSAQDTASNVVSKAQQVASDATSKVQETYNSATSSETKQFLKETYDSSAKNVKEAVNSAGQKATQVKKDVQKGAEQAGTKANQIKDDVVSATSEEEGRLQDQWQEVGKKSKKKAGQAKDAAAKTAQDVTETAQSKIEQVKDTASKNASETKKIADEKAHTAKAAAEEQSEKVKDTAEDTKDELKSTDIDRKDQDKIIAQSQTIRNETVNTKSGSKAESKPQPITESGGASYAAVAAENVPEEEKGDHVVIDDEDLDTTNAMSNSSISPNDSVDLSSNMNFNSLTDSYYHVNPMTSSSSNLSNSMINDDLPPMTPRSRERWHARRRGDGSSGVVSMTSSPVSPTNSDAKTNPSATTNMEPIPNTGSPSTNADSNKNTDPPFAIPSSNTEPDTDTNVDSAPPSTSPTASPSTTEPQSQSQRPPTRSRRSTTTSSGGGTATGTSTRPRPRHHRTSTSSSSNSFISYGNEYGSGGGANAEGENMNPEIPHSPSGLRWMY